MFSRRHALTKTCTKCGTTKDETEFYQIKRNGQSRHGSCKSCAKSLATKWARANPARHRENGRRYAARLRLGLLTHYSGGAPKCACCGESESKFLAIDHIAGGGREHRAKHRSPHAYFKWFRDNGFPAGFQVLCHNCNCAKGFYGSCPHTEKS